MSRLSDEQIDRLCGVLKGNYLASETHDKIDTLCQQAKSSTRERGEMVLVPREPTEAMRQAGCDAIQEYYREDGGWCGLAAAQEQMTLTWAAMLAAAGEES